MHSAPALVLFDIDGTLVRRAGPHHRQALVDAVHRVTGGDRWRSAAASSWRSAAAFRCSRGLSRLAVAGGRSAKRTTFRRRPAMARFAGRRITGFSGRWLRT